jgi:hypothetical protein
MCSAHVVVVRIRESENPEFWNLREKEREREKERKREREKERKRERERNALKLV